jgi:hypothetical protein
LLSEPFFSFSLLFDFGNEPFVTGLFLAHCGEALWSQAQVDQLSFCWHSGAVDFIQAINGAWSQGLQVLLGVWLNQ